MTLTVVQWNCRGFQAHKQELDNFLPEAAVAPNIVCVEETFQKPNLATHYTGRTALNLMGWSSHIVEGRPCSLRKADWKLFKSNSRVNINEEITTDSLDTTFQNFSASGEVNCQRLCLVPEWKRPVLFLPTVFPHLRH